MADSEFKLCSHCRKQVSTSNLIMHEAHCARHISLCKRCHTAIPTSEMDEHVATYHSTVQCPQCSLSLDKVQLQSHLEYDCVKRQIECEYCELEYHLDALSDHENYCGSRTTQCPVCHQYVMLKDFKKHEKSSCSFPEQKKPLPNDDSVVEGVNESCRRGFLDRGDSNFVVDEMGRLMNTQTDSELFGDGRREPKSSYEMMVNEYHRQMYPEDNSNNVAFPTLPTRYSADLKELENEFQMGSRHQDESMIPCEFCGVNFTIDSIVQHQAMCESSLLDGKAPNSPREEFLETDAGISRRRHNDVLWSSNGRGRSDISPIQTDKFSHLDINDDRLRKSGNQTEREVTLLPCEFCGTLCPSVTLLQHQEICEGNAELARGDTLNDLRTSVSKNNANENHPSYAGHNNLSIVRNPLNSRVKPNEKYNEQTRYQESNSNAVRTTKKVKNTPVLPTGLSVDNRVFSANTYQVVTSDANKSDNRNPGRLSNTDHTTIGGRNLKSQPKFPSSGSMLLSNVQRANAHGTLVGADRHQPHEETPSRPHVSGLSIDGSSVTRSNTVYTPEHSGASTRTTAASVRNNARRLAEKKTVSNDSQKNPRRRQPDP